MMACGAYQQSDQMFCAECKLTWDIGDLDPPVCGETLLTRSELRERLMALSERMAGRSKPCGICDVNGPTWCVIGQERGAPCNPISKG